MTNPYVTGLRCRECDASYPAEPRHVCDECFGPLEVEYDLDALRANVSRAEIAAGPASLWRYRKLLPVAGPEDTSAGVGFTPLQHARNLGRALGLPNLYLKNDTLNPTLSFKDRVVAVAVEKAREFSFDTIACASTGNLAGAVAAAGARYGLRTFVFVPANTEPAKIANALVYGATVVTVEGTYDELNRLCAELADRERWAFVNVNVRPYYGEGSKTLLFETVEQLGWRLPDHIVIPVASGALLTNTDKAIREITAVGLVEPRRVRISGAQAAGCAPVATAWKSGGEIEPVRQPETIAKSLAIGNPADGYYALRIASDTGGEIESVTDAEIVEGIKLLASCEGIYAETAGGTTTAVLAKLARAGRIDPIETVVAYITGNGLKTPDAVTGHLAATLTVRPTVESFQAALAARVGGGERELVGAR